MEMNTQMVSGEEEATAASRLVELLNAVVQVMRLNANDLQVLDFALRSEAVNCRDSDDQISVGVDDELLQLEDGSYILVRASRQWLGAWTRQIQ